MDFNTIKEQSDKLYWDLHTTHSEFFQLWVNQMLFSWRWWIGISIIILPWALWLFVRKKDSSDRLLYVAFFIMISSAMFDITGVALGLWSYPITIMPIMPGFLTFDICALPVVTMLFIQFLPKIHPLIKALVYASLASFVFEPLMVWVGLYEIVAWKHIYSFPILIVFYLVANFLSKRKNFNYLSNQSNV